MICVNSSICFLPTPPDISISKCFPFLLVFSSCFFNVYRPSAPLAKGLDSCGWQGAQADVNQGVRNHFRRVLPTGNKNMPLPLHVACACKGNREQTAISIIDVSEF